MTKAKYSSNHIWTVISTAGVELFVMRTLAMDEFDEEFIEELLDISAVSLNSLPLPVSEANTRPLLGKRNQSMPLHRVNDLIEDYID